MSDYSGRIEPAAEECLEKWEHDADQHASILSTMQISQAISLKRIADSLEVICDELQGRDISRAIQPDSIELEKS